MPTRDQVWHAADEVHRKRERVSQKRVITVLQRRFRGGTPREVGPLLLEWIAEKSYDARLDAAGFPQRLKDAHVAFMERVWDEALVEASLRFEAKERKVEAERQAARQLMDEAYADAEVAACEAGLVRARASELEAEVASLRAGNARARQEAEALADANARLRARLDRIRAEEFWDRVMREVAALMPPGGTMPVEDILAGLRPSIHRGARLHREPLDAATLRKKMAVRAWHRKYFEEGPDGALVRKAG